MDAQRLLVVAVLLLALMLPGCTSPTPINPETSLRSITAQEIAQDLVNLASDGFEGRKPGTRGEDSTVAFLEKRFREIGLAPGNPDGSYIQSVALLGVKAHAKASVAINGRKIPLRTPEDIVARAQKDQDRVVIRASEMAFAGYGVEAPEFGWNDYEGVDVKGKTVLVLRGEPSRPSLADTATTDSTFFGGRRLTLHGMRAHKRDVALAKGASAVIFVAENQAAYEGNLPGYSREELALEEEGRQTPGFVWGSMPPDRLRELLHMAGHNLDTLIQRSRQPNFRATPLGLTISFDISLKPRTLLSRNVVAKLDGSDPRLRNEYILYTAHWDHFGRDTSLPGDQIYNGAVDNAFGTAQMLAVAEAFRALPRPPRRSVLFVATTAEEAYLVGARYYVSHPLYPLERTVADINIDISFPLGPTSDVISFDGARSELEDIVREVAAKQQRTITHDPFPEEGFYFRMDHFEFAKAGIPAISLWPGTRVVGRPGEFGKEKIQEYFRHTYHKVIDEPAADWDYSAAVQDAQLYFLTGLQLAESDRWPEWKPASEFKTRRAHDAPRTSP